MEAPIIIFIIWLVWQVVTSLIKAKQENKPPRTRPSAGTRQERSLEDKLQEAIRREEMKRARPVEPPPMPRTADPLFPESAPEVVVRQPPPAPPPFPAPAPSPYAPSSPASPYARPEPSPYAMPSRPEPPKQRHAPARFSGEGRLKRRLARRRMNEKRRAQSAPAPAPPPAPFAGKQSAAGAPSAGRAAHELRPRLSFRGARSLRHAVIYSEVLGPPRAKRRGAPYHEPRMF